MFASEWELRSEKNIKNEEGVWKTREKMCVIDLGGGAFATKI